MFDMVFPLLLFRVQNLQRKHVENLFIPEGIIPSSLVYLFIYGLFTNAVSSSDYIVLKNRIINE
jgi:hypothetical protein